MPEFEALAKRILEFRRKHGESQIEFAANCGVSVFTISAIENGTSDVKLRTLQNIASYTGYTVSGLVDTEGDND